MEIALPAGGAAVVFGVAVMASAVQRAAVTLVVSVGGTPAARGWGAGTDAGGAFRPVTLSVLQHNPAGGVTANTTAAFSVPAAAATIDLRVLADRAIVEAYAGAGQYLRSTAW